MNVIKSIKLDQMDGAIIRMFGDQVLKDYPKKGQSYTRLMSEFESALMEKLQQAFELGMEEGK